MTEIISALLKPQNHLVLRQLSPPIAETVVLEDLAIGCEKELYEEECLTGVEAAESDLERQRRPWPIKNDCSASCRNSHSSHF
jgi:hypothetical protein